MSAMRILLPYTARPHLWDAAPLARNHCCAWPILHYMQYCTSRAGIRQWRATNVGSAAAPLRGARACALLRVPGTHQAVRQWPDPERREQQQKHPPAIPAALNPGQHKKAPRIVGIIVGLVFFVFGVLLSLPESISGRPVGLLWCFFFFVPR